MRRRNPLVGSTRVATTYCSALHRGFHGLRPLNDGDHGLPRPRYCRPPPRFNSYRCTLLRTHHYARHSEGVKRPKNPLDGSAGVTTPFSQKHKYFSQKILTFWSARFIMTKLGFWRNLISPEFLEQVSWRSRVAWSSAHDWKSCRPQNGLKGSNPFFSAKVKPAETALKRLFQRVFSCFPLDCKLSQSAKYSILQHKKCR